MSIFRANTWRVTAQDERSVDETSRGPRFVKSYVAQVQTRLWITAEPGIQDVPAIGEKGRISVIASRRHSKRGASRVRNAPQAVARDGIDDDPVGVPRAAAKNAATDRCRTASITEGHRTAAGHRNLAQGHPGREPDEAA